MVVTLKNCIPHSVFMYFVWFSQSITIVSLNNWFVFIIEVEFVLFCARNWNFICKCKKCQHVSLRCHLRWGVTSQKWEPQNPPKVATWHVAELCYSSYSVGCSHSISTPPIAMLLKGFHKSQIATESRYGIVTTFFPYHLLLKKLKDYVLNYLPLLWYKLTECLLPYFNKTVLFRRMYWQWNNFLVNIICIIFNWHFVCTVCVHDVFM